MKTDEALGIGIILLLLFWPWKEQTSVTIGPPTSYGPLPPNQLWAASQNSSFYGDYPQPDYPFPQFPDDTVFDPFDLGG